MAQLRGDTTAVGARHRNQAGVLVPQHLFARGGWWYVKKVVRGRRFRKATGVPVKGEPELLRAMARQLHIEEQWDRVDGVQPPGVGH